MPRTLQGNITTPAPVATTFPPLPHVPEPAIFDPSYAATLEAVLSDAYFPPNTPPQKIYGTRLKVIEAILASRKESAHSISINLMVAFVSMALLCVFLLVRIRRNRQRALLGDVAAAQKIVLPAFEPLLWLLGGLNITLIVSFGTLLLTGDVGDYYFRVTIELAIAIKMINGMVVVTYMQQPSLSVRALWAAVGCDGERVGVGSQPKPTALTRQLKTFRRGHSHGHTAIDMATTAVATNPVCDEAA